MNYLTGSGYFLFMLSIVLILLFFLFYPLAAYIRSLFKSTRNEAHPEWDYSISIIVAAHRAEHLIIKKIQNVLDLIKPTRSWELIIFCDGLHEDDTRKKVQPFLSESIKFFSSDQHEGKAEALNSAVRASRGEILVFSDADAILKMDALVKLLRHFADDKIGGVCGREVIHETENPLTNAHKNYFVFDELLRKNESRIGSACYNSGKLHAIRRSLWRPVPSGVMDDIFTSFTVVKNGFRFVFEEEAVAYIPVPSRSVTHEIKRRRRIVSGSLHAVVLNISLLNPRRYGFYSMSFFVDRILRRTVPFLFIGLLCSSMIIAISDRLFLIVVSAQILFYCINLLMIKIKVPVPLGALHTFLSTSVYFCAGNIGTFLGVVDFCRGKKPDKWTPVKQDHDMI